MKFDSDPDYGAGLALWAPSIELFDVDRGVHNVRRTARIAAMIAIANTGLPSLAMSVAPAWTA